MGHYEHGPCVRLSVRMWVWRGRTLAGIGEGAASSTVPRKPSGVINVAGRLVSVHVMAPRGRVADKRSRLVLVTWATVGKFRRF